MFSGEQKQLTRNQLLLGHAIDCSPSFRATGVLIKAFHKLLVNIKAVLLLLPRASKSFEDTSQCIPVILFVLGIFSFLVFYNYSIDHLGVN
jgi:hypothetical protein